MDNQKELNAEIEAAKKAAASAEKMILKSFMYGGIIGIIGVIGFPLTIDRIGARLMWICILLALASLVVGFFIGTLFGMPKRNSKDDSDYTLNNSLVEISEWLTKIIVGLGLVNLKQIPGYLATLGETVSRAAGTENSNSLNVFAMCATVYFAVFGLYIGYNYMRIVLSQKYKQADDNLLRKKLELKVDKLETEIAEKAKVERVLIDEANKSKAEVSEIALSDQQDNDYIDSMKIRAAEKLRKGLIENSTDPQKGQWGSMSMNNQRKLEAEVKEVMAGIGIYNISLKVSATNEKSSKMNDGDVVLFALHDTFGDPPIRLIPVKNGVAEVTFLSSGSFTVGAFADKGETELELDLASLPGVSEQFKNS
jgi:hypothetical protein